MLNISLGPNENRPTSPTPGIVRLDGTEGLGKSRNDTGQTAHEGVKRRLGSPQIEVNALEWFVFYRLHILRARWHFSVS